MNSLLHDVKYGFRMLRKSRGFSVVAILTLGLGIGANTAIFSLLNEQVLRPLPVKDPADLYSVVLVDELGEYNQQGIVYPVVVDYHEGASSFSELISYAPFFTQARTEDATSEFIFGQFVSSNYFDVLGISASQGRTIGPTDSDTSEGIPVVISHEYWRNTFVGYSDVVGKPIFLTRFSNPDVELPCVVIGIAPPGFKGLDQNAPHVWFPTSAHDHFRTEQPIDFRMVGRLKSHVSIAQAESELDQLADSIAEKYSGKPVAGYEAMGIFPSDARTELRHAALGKWGPLKSRAKLRRATMLSFTVAGLVLLIACGNIANLLLARAVKREREFAIRWAVGAGRNRMLAQMVTEGLLLTSIGATVGIAFAMGLQKLALKLSPQNTDLLVQTQLDWRVVVFTLALMSLSGVVFGLVPMIQSLKLNLNQSLKHGQSQFGSPGVKWKFRDSLVAIQVAFCLFLLVGTGLCLRSYGKVFSVDPGFKMNRLMTATLELGRMGVDGESAGATINLLVERIEQIPGVVSATFAANVPLGPTYFGGVNVEQIDGYVSKKDEFLIVQVNHVGPKYFETVGIPVILSANQAIETNNDVIWASEDFVQRYWPNTDPLGKGVGSVWTIDGVVAASRTQQLWEETTPQLYIQGRSLLGSRVNILVRTERDPEGLLRTVSDVARSFRAGMEEIEFRPVSSYVEESLQSNRLMLSLLGGFAVLAIILAAVGIYGTISYIVSSTTRELGTRMALGVTAMRILGLVYKRGLRNVAVGIVVGIAGAAVFARVYSSFLFEVALFDPITYMGVLVVLCVAATLACLGPALRATRINPMDALRTD